MSISNRNLTQEDVGDFEFDEEEYIRNCFADATASSNGNDDRQYLKYESNKKKPVVYTKQAIPPDDIRRTYAKAFESAWNGYEREQLQELFHGIGTKDMITIVVYPRGNPHGPALRELHGPETITDYYYRYQESVPDSLFLIHGTKYVIKQNGHISIVCNFSLTGSRLFLVDTDENRSGKSQYDVHQVETEINSHLATVSPETAAGRKHLAPQVPQARNDVDLDDYLNPYNATNETLVFKDSYTVKNKHDKYRRLNHSTMGEYIDALSGDKNVNHSNSSGSDCIKNESGEEFANGKRSLSVENAPKKRFAPTDVLVSSEAKFGLSALLHSSVKMNITGILRLNVDANKKVYKMELMCAFDEH